MAAATWYIDAAIGYSLKDHARYICIRYEDVVQRPFELISELVSKFTAEYVAPGIIEQRFVENSHRQSMDRVESWSVKEYGAIENANDVMVDPSIQNSFYGFLEARLNPMLANDMKLQSLSMREVAVFYGYTFEEHGGHAKRDFRALMQYSFNFAFDFLHGDADIAELPRYTRPILL
jgi:hypothetical protein